ncbi:MAG: flagellar hook-length control protein FliK [Ignavibacteriales bacterium]|nr:flagellar hook-length control protein FliK [Ignavibacteriales bacterium]
MADIVSILGVAQSPTSLSPKKSQNETDAGIGSAQDVAAPPGNTFNPILEQMIAASQAGTTPKVSESSGDAVETQIQSAPDESDQASVSVPCISEELMKVAVSAQGLMVLPSGAQPAAKTDSAASTVSETLITGIGIAVSTAAAGGGAGISLARDLELSPSAVVNPQADSSATVLTYSDSLPANVAAIASAVDEPNSGSETAVSATLSPAGHADAISQLMVKTSPDQVLTEDEQNALSSLRLVRPTGDSGLSQARESVPDRTMKFEPASARENTMQNAPAKPKGQLESTGTKSESPSSPQGKVDATQWTARVTSQKDAVTPKSEPGNQKVEVERPFGASANAIRKSDVPGIQLPPSPRMVQADLDSGKSNPAEVIAPSGSGSPVTLTQVSRELLKLVQDRLGLTRVASGKPAVKAENSSHGAVDIASFATGNGTTEVPIVPDGELPVIDVAKPSLQSETSNMPGGKHGSIRLAESAVDVVDRSDEDSRSSGGVRRSAGTNAASASVDVATAGGIVGAGDRPISLLERKEGGAIPSGASVSSIVKPEVKQQELGAEVGEKEKEQDQPATSEKSVSKQDASTKTSVDSKGPSAAGTTFKEAAEIQRNQPTAFQARIERHETVTVQQKQATFSPELLNSVPDQVAKEISLKLLDKVSEMRLVLKPESLGEVELNVRMEEGSMVARIEVSHNQVRTALEANLAQLSDALANKGIRVDRIDILTSSNSSSRESQSQGREKSKGGSKRRADVEGVEAYESTRFLGYNTVEYLI